MAKQIYLIRHGETEWSLSGQHTGLTDIPLTAEGQRVSKLLEPILSKVAFTTVLTSPLQRATRTCELAGLKSQAEIEPNLVEWNYGEYEGLTQKQIQEKSPQWMIFKDGCPGGETPEQVAARADRVIAKIKDAKGDVALFAHGHILKVFVARWLGFPPLDGAHFILDTATISILSYYRDIPAIKCWNMSVK